MEPFPFLNKAFGQADFTFPSSVGALNGTNKVFMYTDKNIIMAPGIAILVKGNGTIIKNVCGCRAAFIAQRTLPIGFESPSV